MRIGIFSDSYVPSVSGVVTSILMLRQGLEALGHEVFIFCTTAKEIPDKDDKQIIRLSGIPMPLRTLAEYRIVFFASRAIKKIRNLALDIIHIHTEFTIGQLGLKAARVLKVPVVYTMHTLYEDYINHISPFFEKHYKEELVQILRNEVKRIVEKVDATFVPSSKIKKLIVDKIHSKGNVYIVPTGLDLKPFDKNNYSNESIDSLKEKLGIKKDEFVLLFIGRLAPEKNLKWLIKAYKELTKEIDNTRFLIVGGGYYEEELKNGIAALEINDKIITTGFIKREELGLYYQLGNCFVNASVSETQGLTFIESLAASLIIVSVQDEAVNMILKEGYNGYYYDGISDFIEVIKKVKDNPETTNEMAENALISVLPFSKERYVEKAVSIYQTLLVEKKI